MDKINQQQKLKALEDEKSGWLNEIQILKRKINVQAIRVKRIQNGQCDIDQCGPNFYAFEKKIYCQICKHYVFSGRLT